MDTDNQPPRSWAEGQALKDQLFDRAKVGEITGDQADAEAIRLGLGSLSRRPAPEEFRPEDEAHWTLPMAVAWIAYLDLDEVREWSAPFREGSYFWLWQRWRWGFDGPIYEGWHLEQRSKPTLSLLAMGAAYDRATDDKPLSMSIGEAQGALWSALRVRMFTASGIDTETGRRVDIPALDWHELVPVEGKGEVDEVRRGLLGEGYREVLFPSAVLRDAWKKAKSSLPTFTALPLSMRPDGDGYMPLYCAAEWIATQGGRVDFDGWQESHWRPAFDVLLAAISSEKVRVTGRRGHLREPVPAAVFADLRVFYPSGNDDDSFLGTGEPFLQSWMYVDDEQWRAGNNDQITSKFADQWTAIMVEKGDVRALWPFENNQENEGQRTGLPGRPSKAKHLIEDELARRAASDQLAPSLAEEASALLDWLIVKHPLVARPTLGTTRNNIRGDYNRLKPRTK